MHPLPTRIFFSVLALMLMFTACSANKDNAEKPVQDSMHIAAIKHDTADVSHVTQPPIINITDSFIKKQWVLYVKDSAANSNRINYKLAQIYKSILPQAAKSANVLLMNAPMAWYKNRGISIFFEAGYEIDKKPEGKLPTKVFLKSIGGDSAVVAHFYGPYEITVMGYEALNDWIKTNKKKTAGQPYEMYVTDPFMVSTDKKNPYRIRTDIFIPHK